MRFLLWLRADPKARDLCVSREFCRGAATVFCPDHSVWVLSADYSAAHFLRETRRLF